MDIKDYLMGIGANFISISHPPVYTVNEAKTHRAGMEDCTHAKNLFLRDSKKGVYYLVTLEADRSVQIKNIRQMLSAKKLRFATPEELYEILKLEPGSVSPLALLEAKQTNETVKYAIDNFVWNSTKVAFHPNRNDETLIFEGKVFQNVIASFSFEPIILTFDKNNILP